MKPIIFTTLAAALLLVACPGRSEENGKGVEQPPLTPDLKPGDYVWEPEVSPAGPVAIIVSLPTQTLYVYRNGVRIGRSTVSTGKPGHRTPTGVFTILQKNEVHHSTTYHNASMPFMERLTWSGVAIHAGGLPGYPESHGCVHVPLDFAKKLYTVTDKGTTVLITDEKAAPGMTQAQPGLLFETQPNPPPGQTPPSPNQTPPANQPAGFTWKPEASPNGPVSIIFSSADKQVYVYRGGLEIGRAAIGGAEAGQSYGNHVYAALDGTDPDGTHQWNALGSGDGSPAPDIQLLAKRLVIPPQFLAQLRATVVPGATLVITDHPVDRTTQSGKDYSVLDAADQPEQPTAPNATPTPQGTAAAPTHG